MWKLTLFGAPALNGPEGSAHIARRKAWALLAYLAVTQQRQARETLAALLWPEYDESAARADLSRALSTLRKASAPELFLADRDNITIAPEAALWLDVRRFEDLLLAARAAGGADSDAQVQRLEEAAALYQTDFMAGFTLPACPAFDEWQLLQSQQLRRDMVWVLESLADIYEARGAHDQAIHYAHRLMALDPLHEPAQRRLMQLYAVSGQLAAAIRQYETCRRLLAKELGVAPQPQTVQLFEDIRARRYPAPAPSPAAADTMPAVTIKDELPPFVTREAELQHMAQRLHAALQGDGSLLFITGGAGRGKTTLMQEFVRRALQEHPDLVAAGGSGKAWGGMGDAYLPFRELLGLLGGNIASPYGHTLVSLEQARRLWAIMPFTAQAIMQHGPQLLDLLIAVSPLTARLRAAGYTGVEGSAMLLSADEWRERDPQPVQQTALLGQYASVLHHLAQQHPLLVTLDDLQWLDEPSTALLFQLGRQLRGSRLLIVGAFRPDELLPTPQGASHPIRQLVAEFSRDHGDITVDLARSDGQAGRRFVDAYLDMEANDLDGAFRQALFEKTAGHPLFTVELLREMQQRGDLIRDAEGRWRQGATIAWEALPARVEAVIAHRIERLSSQARAVLTAASVEGQPFTAEVVAHVLDTDEETVLYTLATQLAEQQRLVREAGDVQTGPRVLSLFQFAHDLFRHYLYGALPGARRRRLHSRVAAALSHLYGAHSDNMVHQLAQHHAAAGEWAQAAPHFARAGDLARERAALADAVGHYQAALAHWPGGDEPGRARIRRLLGECLWMLGRHEQALEELHATSDSFLALDDAAAAAAVQSLLARVYWETGRPAKTEACLQRALRLLQDDEGPEMAWALAGMGAYHMHLGDYDQALRYLERALTIGRRHDLEALTIQCLCDMGSCLSGKGDWSGLDLERESLQRALAANRAHDAGRAYVYIAEALIYLGRYGDARSLLHEALDYMQRMQLSYMISAALRHLVEIDWLTGEWRSALSKLPTPLAALEGEVHRQLTATYWSILLARIAADLGQYERAQKLLVSSPDATAVDSLDPRVALLGEVARAAAAKGDLARANAAAREILEWTDEARYLYPNISQALLTICRLAHAAVQGATAGDARQAWRQLRRLEQQFGARPASAGRHEAEGWLALAEGDPVRAVDAFSQAAALWQSLGHSYDRARALAGYSEAALASGDRKAARSAAGQALERLNALALQLDDPQLKHSFLASPLWRRLRHLQQGSAAPGGVPDRPLFRL